jgi:hypothetical protein
VLYYFAREAAGAVGTRHSPRPLLGERLTHHSGASRRESAELCLPSLRGAKRQSNPFLLWLWIASRSLSSGAHSRDPVARNDNFNTLCF